jgi:hypothetical protein
MLKNKNAADATVFADLKSLADEPFEQERPEAEIEVQRQSGSCLAAPANNREFFAHP